MKTPYDTVVRLRKNALDALRRDMALAEGRQDEAHARLRAHHAALEAERIASPAAPFADFGAYLARMQGNETAIRREITRLEAEVDALAARIEAEFGEFKTLDLAAQTFRDTQRRALAQKEQAELDEAALQRHIRNQSGF